jgi:hypothetical protein
MSFAWTTPIGSITVDLAGSTFSRSITVIGAPVG